MRPILNGHSRTPLGAPLCSRRRTCRLQVPWSPAGTTLPVGNVELTLHGARFRFRNAPGDSLVFQCREVEASAAAPRRNKKNFQHDQQLTARSLHLARFVLSSSTTPITSMVTVPNESTSCPQLPPVLAGCRGSRTERRARIAAASTWHPRPRPRKRAANPASRDQSPGSNGKSTTRRSPRRRSPGQPGPGLLLRPSIVTRHDRVSSWSPAPSQSTTFHKG